MTVVLELAARGLLLLSLAWLVVVALRRHSAALRAGVWTAALAGLLVLPLASLGAPAWRVPVWPPAAVASSSVEQPPAAGVSVRASAPAFSIARTGQITENRAAVTSVEPVAPTRIDWGVVALMALAAGALVLVARVALSHRRLARIVRAASPAEPDWSILADEVGASLALKRSVPVRVTGAMSVPAVAGIWRPVLVLPIESREWAPDVRRAVVLHELAHIARRDPLSQLMSQLTCAVYWCVPLAWFGARRAAALRERACDDIVLAAGIRPTSYAESLIAIARSACVPVSPAMVAMAQPSRMRERVEAILNPALRRGRVTRLAIVTTSLVVGVATAALGVIEPTTVEAAGRPIGIPGLSALQSAKGPTTVTPQADRICGGVGLNKSSSSIQEDNGNRRWTVKLSGDGCTVDLRAEGQFEFTPDFTDISRISSNGFFRVDVTDRGVRRQLEIEPRGGTLTRTWRVDGKERPYDAEAKAWFAAFLIELDRRTAIGVDTRLPHLVRQGGVDAVLKETALMSSDYARSQYYEKLPGATKVSSADAVRVLGQAASLTKSDYYLAELVETYGGPPVQQDAATRKALIQLIDSIESDYYQANSIERIVGAGAPASGDVDVMLGLVKRMKSDHYKAEVMTKILRADNLGPAQQAAVAAAAATVGSDYYAAEVLTALAQKGLRDDAVRRAYFDAVAKIDSDHYQGEVLDAFLKSPSLAERDLLDAVATTKSMRSDYNRSQVLERIARHSAVTERVRTAVLDAASGMSRHYAEQVRRAVGK
jgi:beta-lactamase regulating signal transducer with metallopeptidase domain